MDQRKKGGIFRIYFLENMFGSGSQKLNRWIYQAPDCHEVATETHHPHYQSLEPGNHQNLQALCHQHHQLAHFENHNSFLGKTTTTKSQTIPSDKSCTKKSQS